MLGDYSMTSSVQGVHRRPSASVTSKSWSPSSRRPGVAVAIAVGVAVMAVVAVEAIAVVDEQPPHLGPALGQARIRRW
jgi:hypothetical protein